MAEEAIEARVKKVIFITLSNIGDVVLTLPSLDYLKNKFKDASFTVLSGPKVSTLFYNDPRIKENIAYDKHVPFREKFTLFNRLRREKFDVIIDLRDTVFRWVTPAQFKNPYSIKIPDKIRHLRLRHLYKTKAAFRDKTEAKDIRISPLSIHLDKETQVASNKLLKKHNLSFTSDYIVVSPGARSHAKRWHKEGFIAVCHELLKHYSIVFIGDKDERLITQEINKHLDNRCVDLAGQTTLQQAIAILKKSKLVICNDSAVLHISSYLNIPTLAIFGPTDENGSGPSSDKSAVVRKNTICSPCLRDDCKNNWRCMKNISPQLVIDYANALIAGKTPKLPLDYRRILITRTDRLGDVLLSTPVIKNLRDNLPGAYIAVAVQSSLKDILKSNPYLDEVILLDKRGKHRGLINLIRFAISLKNRNFDLVLILHPTLRMHLILFFAGIKERIGYDRKWGFLNTRILKHKKQFGQKHESEYALDFLNELGISSVDKSMFMPIYKESEDWIESFFDEKQLHNSKVVTVHRQASCPSKIWPQNYFNRLIDDIIDIYNANIIYVGIHKDDNIKEKNGIVNLSGKISLSQLASVLKHSDLFISNDSGPVHMAVALGTPVISIFGRRQPGLGPRRWGPLGTESVILHKDIGCKICLAHDCEKNFACLKAIKPKEVLSYVDKFLSK